MKTIRCPKNGQHSLLVLEHGEDIIKEVTYFAQH